MVEHTSFTDYVTADSSAAMLRQSEFAKRAVRRRGGAMTKTVATFTGARQVAAASSAKRYRSGVAVQPNIAYALIAMPRCRRDKRR
jgi:hypothetical protein